MTAPLGFTSQSRSTRAMWDCISMPVRLLVISAKPLALFSRYCRIANEAFRLTQGQVG